MVSSCPHQTPVSQSPFSPSPVPHLLQETSTLQAAHSSPSQNQKHTLPSPPAIPFPLPSYFPCPLLSPQLSPASLALPKWFPQFYLVFLEEHAIPRKVVM